MECLSKVVTLMMAYAVRSSLAVSGDNNCLACKNLADTFLYGLSQTKRAHHGGGNTEWEEKKLGKYHTSEMRYHDVEDYVCKSIDDVKIEKEDEQKCYNFMNDHEEDVEEWYFNQRTQFPDFKTWLCITTTKTCCPSNSWGAECQPCPGDPQRPCFGRGKCDGEGTRRGTGKCKCDAGYQGKLCRKCTTNYFASLQNDTHVTCQVCNSACRGGCTGPSAAHCVNCKDGWVLVDNAGCKDVNECDKSPCNGVNEECKNTVGSYRCQCKENYKKENGICVFDVSEEDSFDSSAEDEEVTATSEDEPKVELVQEQKPQSDDAKSAEDESLVAKKQKEIIEDAAKASKSDDKPKESVPKAAPKSKESNRIPQEPRPPMTEEHRRKVKDHLKQVMDTIESLQKGGGSLPRNKNLRYSDPQVQAVMDKLDKVKDKNNDGHGIHRIEL